MVIEKVSSPRILEGEIVPPGDKSISHRAVILNGMALGSALVTNFPAAEDCQASVSCLRRLGVPIELEAEGRLRVTGVGRRGFSEPEDVLDAANSATTLRFLAGLLASQSFLSIISGDDSLRSRPMGRIIEPLRLMGAQIWGRRDDSRPPLVIRGAQLQGISYPMPVASAQVKSALLLAGLSATGTTAVEEPAPSRDHTERMLRAMGGRIEVSGRTVSIAGGAELKALDVAVPGDLSAAAFWLVAAALHPRARIRVCGVGVNPTRSGILEVLQQMGARIRVENERMQGSEPVADVVAESSALRGVKLGGDLIPRIIDELPLVALAGARAQGVTVIREAGELRVKETDRVAATAQELSKLGAVIEELPDGMVVHGGQRLRGACCHSRGDHRLAMTLGVAGLVAEGETVVERAEAAAVSYPSFWDDLARLSTDAKAG